MPKKSNSPFVKTAMDTEIVKEVDDLRVQENLPDSGKSFVLWVLMNYFDLDRETAASKIIDSGNDKRVDAFVDDEDTINVVQCKFYENPSKEIGDREIAMFKGCLDWLKNPEDVKKLNVDRLYDAASTYSERWLEGVDVQLHFFAFGKFADDAKQERVVFNRAEPRVQMYFHDADDIRTIYLTKSKAENPLADEMFEFELIAGEYFKRKDNSIVATIKGKYLLSIYEKYGDILFERNIRLYKGARKGSINAKIIETALDQDEQKKFWYYNNGISFVCRDFKLVSQPDSPNQKIEVSEKRTILEIYGPQVINGCQTTVSLFEAHERSKEWESIPDEVQILARFIKVPVKEVDRITLYTNSQNPVSEIQLKSNDSLQARLKKNLSEYDPRYFYSIKEGDWQKLSQTEKRVFGERQIQLSEAAQSIYAFTTDPAFARRYKNRLFSDKYDVIFRKDLYVEEIILPWRILNVINEKIAKFRSSEFNRLKKEPDAFTSEDVESIKRREFLIYSNLIMLFFAGNIIKKKYGHYSHTVAQRLLNNRLEDRISRIFDYIVGVLSFSDKLSKEKNLPRYLKNIEAINGLYDEVQKQLITDRARTKEDPLKGMLPEIK